MRNIRLTLAYDGSNYVGWQVQPNGTSVQAMVEQAIEKLTGETVKTRAAGRTDSGVHAFGQVANFGTQCNIPCEGIQAGLQAHLPADIIVCEATEVDESFHATYSATSKRYRYVIFNSRVSNPFLRKYAWRCHGEIDAAAMHEAGQQLLGTHDFRCFESHFPNKATSVRTITELTVARNSEWNVWSPSALGGSMLPGSETNSEPEKPFVTIDVVADGFLYNMVRAIVGTLLKVGQAGWTAEQIRHIIEGQDRSQAGPTAPPHGLYLVHVDYDD